MSTTAKIQNYLPALRPLLRIRGGYLRSIEFAAIAVVLLAVTAVGYLFFNILGERSQKIDSLQTESNVLRKQIEQFEKQRREGGEKANNTQMAIDNLAEFNNRFLKDRMQGRLSIIDEVNELVRKDGVNLMSSISFQPIEDADEVARQQQLAPTKVRRNQSERVDLYPGMRVLFSVNGPYQNFRKFLYDIETNKLFMIIERLNLQSGEGQQLVRNGQNFGRNAANQGPEGLTIQLELKVHFRKQVNATN